MKKKTTTKTKNKKTRFAQHRRSKTRPDVRFLVMALKRRWDSMDTADRAERIRELIDMGCTRRGLATDLRISPTNVRFYFSLSSADVSEKQRLRNGASAKELFDRKKRLADERLRLAKLQQERENAAVSDALAADVTRFCLAPWQFQGRARSLPGGQAEEFFGELAQRIDMRVAKGMIPPPASPHKSFRDVLVSCCPVQRAYDFWIPWLMDWLIEALLRYEPNAPIRDAALKKARALVEKAGMR